MNKLCGVSSRSCWRAGWCARSRFRPATSIRCRCSRRRRRRSAKPTCGASRSPAPATTAPSGRPPSTPSTSTGRGSTRWPTTRERSTGKPARARKRSIASPGSNPASWKYGLGWRGGTPIQKQLRQTHIVNGSHAWHIDGEGGAAGRGVAGGCRALSARPVAQPAGVPQGGATARRQSQGDLAMGADRDGPRRQRRRARRRCTSCRSRCSASTASKRRSTRRTRFSASRRR